MRASGQLFFACTVVVFASCDNVDVGTEREHISMVAEARAYYEEALAHPPSDFSTYDLSRLTHARPPDWSMAQVLRHYNGQQMIAAPLSGTALRPANDSIASMGVIVFEVGGRNRVDSAKILEFTMSKPAHSAAFIRYLTDYWREEFQDSLVSVAEFSIHYTPQHGRVFQVGEAPREARIDVRPAEPGKGYGVTDTCIYFIYCYEDPETGHILWCEGSSIRLMYCIGDGEDDDECLNGCGGGGDGGGDNEDECDCSNEHQCDLEAEYKERGDSENWPCSKFYTVPGYLYVGPTGTHNGEHSGYGYINPALEVGLDAVRTQFETDLSVTSGYRCPVGNANVPNSGSNSHHIHGQAADFKTTTLPWSTAVRDTIAEWAEMYGGAVEVIPYTNHIHLAWN